MCVGPVACSRARCLQHMGMLACSKPSSESTCTRAPLQTCWSLPTSLGRMQQPPCPCAAPRAPGLPSCPDGPLCSRSGLTGPTASRPLPPACEFGVTWGICVHTGWLLKPNAFGGVLWLDCVRKGSIHLPARSQIPAAKPTPKSHGNCRIPLEREFNHFWWGIAMTDSKAFVTPQNADGEPIQLSTPSATTATTAGGNSSTGADSAAGAGGASGSDWGLPPGTWYRNASFIPWKPFGRILEKVRFVKSSLKVRSLPVSDAAVAGCLAGWLQFLLQHRFWAELVKCAATQKPALHTTRQPPPVVMCSSCGVCSVLPPSPCTAGGQLLAGPPEVQAVQGHVTDAAQ